jgi:hypothetical protein
MDSPDAQAAIISPVSDIVSESQSDPHISIESPWVLKYVHTMSWYAPCRAITSASLLSELMDDMTRVMLSFSCAASGQSIMHEGSPMSSESAAVGDLVSPSANLSEQ